MKKEQNIIEIKGLIAHFHDDIIDDCLVCDVYDEEGCTIHKGDVNLNTIVLDSDNNVTVWGTDTNEGRNKAFNLSSLPAKTVQLIHDGLKTRRGGYKQEKVEERTREVANEMKKRFVELVEKALRSENGWDYAFPRGYRFTKGDYGCDLLQDTCK